jgi:hypothetical protein
MLRAPLNTFSSSQCHKGQCWQQQQQQQQPGRQTLCCLTSAVGYSSLKLLLKHQLLSTQRALNTASTSDCCLTVTEWCLSVVAGQDADAPIVCYTATRHACTAALLWGLCCRSSGVLSPRGRGTRSSMPAGVSLGIRAEDRRVGEHVEQRRRLKCRPL